MPAPTPQRSPSMIEDRGLRGARVPERVIDGENGVIRSEGAGRSADFPSEREWHDLRIAPGVTTERDPDCR